MKVDELSVAIVAGIMIPILLYIINQNFEKRALKSELNRQKNMNSMQVTAKFWAVLDKKEYIFINEVLFSLSVMQESVNDEQTPFFLKDKLLKLKDIEMSIEDTAWWEAIIEIVKIEDSNKLKENEKEAIIFYKTLFLHYRKYMLILENTTFENKEMEIVEKIGNFFYNGKILIFDQKYLGLESDKEWYIHFGDSSEKEVLFCFEKAKAKYQYELQRYINEFSMLCSEILLEEINGNNIRKYTENYVYYRINTLFYYFVVKKESKIVISRAKAIIDLYNKWGMDYKKRQSH